MLTMRWRRPFGALTLSALLALLAVPSVHAQGPNACPDGYTGGCCASASPNLPALPQVSWTDARQTCWIDCGPFPSQLGALTLAAPTPTPSCSVYEATLSGPMLACPAPFQSRLRLYYTRRWQQVFPSYGNLFVYRFVAVGNVCVTPNPAWSCQVEPPPATPFVFGFVDYAYRKVGPPPCNLSFVAAALAVGHPCDRFVHDPACPFTADPRPPTHPLDQYTLVAPGTNFLPNANLVPPQGPLTNQPREGLRHVRVNTAGTCTATERFASLQLSNVFRQCACVNPTLTNGPFWRQRLNATTACGSTLDTLPLCPFNYTPPAMTAPFPTLVAWSIGSWGPGAFPGVPSRNQFFLTQGSANYARMGNAVCPPNNPQRGVYYGVENKWAFGGGGKRVDLVDNVQQAVGATTVTPVVGGPAPLGTHVVFFY
jgi:hypothetical protein